MRAGRYVNGRSATLAYRLSGTAAHRLAESVVTAAEQWSAPVRRARRHWSGGNLEGLLDAVAAVEEAGYSLPVDIARSLETELCDADGRVRLSRAAAGLLEQRPDAAFLIYARILGLIDEKRFEEAHEVVSAALCRLCERMRHGSLSASAVRERAETLAKLWKSVDSAARDQMSWIVEWHDGGAAYADFEFVRTFEDMSPDDGGGDHMVTLAFAEPLLQGRRNVEYLRRCALAFEQANTLFQKLHVVRAMCRQGYRRIPDYGPAYAQAREFYERCRPEIDAAVSRGQGGALRDPRAHLRALRSAHSLSAQLGLGEHVHDLRRAMVDFTRGPQGRDGLWMVANALSQDTESCDEAVELVGDVTPGRDQDLRDFYQFAMRAGQYERAHGVFESLPPLGRTRQSALAYANILQRCQRFEEAERLVREVHARLLANVDALDPFISFGLIRRAGELRFAAETARHYASVPQPADPKGVILATPRSIEQLRRTPIAVLMEWKRMGWAVVPIYEGILPLEKTGIDAIDRFAGCIRVSNDLRPDARGWMKAIEPFDKRLEEGVLAWRGIDLSHALWEEAAINRRVHSVTWSCPALRRSLSNLVGWTEKMAMVLETAHETFAKLGLRTGTHVFFNFRLPDAVVRFYGERFGDPRDFFCIHASNGYENYFINFENNVSSRLTIRNMTAHPGVRSSSMPLGEHVIRAASEDKSSVERSLRGMVAIARSKPNGHVGDDAADEMRRRIAAWRGAGGRVACAFGKVVCDSGVPFDGGPGHSSMRDWIDHTIESVKGSRTLLLIKPHPHELREEVACFLNETFRDLLPAHLPENVIYLGHDWFETHELEGLVDLALVYNGTTAVEMALLGIPTVLAGHFGPIDYPLGHAVPADRDDYRRLVRFEKVVLPLPEGRLRAAAWLGLMRSDEVSVPYRYHSRQITNCVVYPPFWFDEDIETYLRQGDPRVRLLAERGVAVEG